MTIGTDTIRGVLKVNGLMDALQFTSWKDFVAAIPSLFSVEIPSGITNVTLGQNQPTDSELDHLWIKLDGANSFVGLYIYSQGAWRKIYPLSNQIFFMYGDSRSVPDGYKLVSDVPGITADQVANMKKIWTQGGTSPIWYSAFHVVFVGF